MDDMPGNFLNALFHLLTASLVVANTSRKNLAEW